EQTDDAAAAERLQSCYLGAGLQVRRLRLEHGLRPVVERRRRNVRVGQVWEWRPEAEAPFMREDGHLFGQRCEPALAILAMGIDLAPGEMRRDAEFGDVGHRRKVERRPCGGKRRALEFPAWTRSRSWP